jgi:hypothetical protein
MPNTILIEKLELQQLIRWLRDIEEDVERIKKEPEEVDDVVERCRGILRTIEKMRGFLIVIKD